MFQAEQYALVDFGDGRKLERFGAYLLDRPAPAAETAAPAAPEAWAAADARFYRATGNDGGWVPPGRLPERWTIDHGTLRFLLRPTPFGHVGLFPEQAENWDWIAEQLRRADRPLEVLNLFAYTGGSTLAAAAAGARVTHVDAARNVVEWARENARASGLESAPVRWIAEDVPKFVRRELRRRRHYDAVILDPPSYGHGPKSEVWKLERDLPVLLQLCARLTRHAPTFLLLTCHTPGFNPRRLSELLAEHLPEMSGKLSARPSSLRTAGGRPLAGGAVVRGGA